jgi:hypothetical protein
VRWVAVRHAADHIHIVATLVRQDGTTTWPPASEWRRCQMTARHVESLYGLRRVGPPDHTAHRYPLGAEINKAIRKGRTSTSRDELRRGSGPRRPPPARRTGSSTSCVVAVCSCGRGPVARTTSKSPAIRWRYQACVRPLSSRSTSAEADSPPI